MTYTITDSDSTANNNTSNDKYNIANNVNDDDSSPDSQYFVTFKCNNYGKMILNHMIDYEDLFMMDEQNYITNHATDSKCEESAKSTYKQSKKSRVGGQRKNISKGTNKEKNVKLNKILIFLKLPEFNPMENVNELHK
ncbi:12846_t:CDS:1, partial [Cetraspora pellucida]